MRLANLMAATPLPAITVLQTGSTIPGPLLISLHQRLLMFDVKWQSGVAGWWLSRLSRASSLLQQSSKPKLAAHSAIRPFPLQPGTDYALLPRRSRQCRECSGHLAPRASSRHSRGLHGRLTRLGVRAKASDWTMSGGTIIRNVPMEKIKPFPLWNRIMTPR